MNPPSWQCTDSLTTIASTTGSFPNSSQPRVSPSIGWDTGAPDEIELTPFTWQDHHDQITAVLDTLELEHVVLVGHDASGPDAIDYALDAPERISQLILLDTYYGHTPALRLPDMIRLFADDQLAPLADAMMQDENQRLWLLQYTASAFGGDPLDPTSVGITSVLPQFFGDESQPDARHTVRAWTRSLFASLDRQDTAIARRASPHSRCPSR